MLHFRRARLPSIIPLERAIARVCQEAWARVGRNVTLAAMNIDGPVHDARRIQVVCSGLPLYGVQLAVDAKLVSPVTRDGRPHDRADNHPGCAVRNAVRRKRRHAVASSYSDSRSADAGLRKLPPLFASLPRRVQQVPLPLSASAQAGLLTDSLLTSSHAQNTQKQQLTKTSTSCTQLSVTRSDLLLETSLLKPASMSQQARTCANHDPDMQRIRVASSPLRRSVRSLPLSCSSPSGLSLVLHAGPPALHELLADACWQEAPEPSRLAARA